MSDPVARPNAALGPYQLFEGDGNTLALERQAAVDRAGSLNDAFFESPERSEILVKIKVIDGSDPVPQAFVDQYDLTPCGSRPLATAPDGAVDGVRSGLRPQRGNGGDGNTPQQPAH